MTDYTESQRDLGVTPTTQAPSLRALGFTMPVEELTLKTASLTNILDWLTQPQGPHLVDGTSTKNPLTALAILITPEALYDPDFPMVGLGLVYKALTFRPPPGARPTLT